MNDLESKLNKSVDFLVLELKGIQTGRATTGLVEEVTIESYGQRMRLKDVATLTIPEPSQVVVEPWDKNNLPLIEKAINLAGLGLNASVQSNIVRIVVPPLSAERRDELAKLVAKKAEETKVMIRNIRRDAIQEVEAQKSSGEIGEDEMDRAKKQIESVIDKIEARINEITEQKVAEIKGN
jgi:ribosome recycling factor